MKYILEISAIGPNLEFNHTETGNNPLDITHLATDAVLRYVRKEKDKFVN
jgi:hypothetical protein